MKATGMIAHALAILLVLSFYSDPSSQPSQVDKAIHSEFSNISQMKKFELEHGANKEVDVVVEGNFRNGGWGIQVWKTADGKVEKKWSAKELENPEFGVILAPADIYQVKDGYDIEIQACAPHQCSDGTNGFLIYSGGSGRIRMAKVVALASGLRKRGTPNYKVNYSPSSLSADEKLELEEVICNSNSITDKTGLPFPCK